MNETITVGQKLYYVPRQRARHEFVTVTKVGRKWLETSARFRLNKDTLAAEGWNGNSPGRAYLSQEDYTSVVNLQNAWRALRQRINNSWSVPEGVTVEKIAAIESSIFPTKEPDHV